MSEPNLNVITFPFPKLNAFDSPDTEPELLKEAKKGGFDKFSNPYAKLASKLFFEGGKLNFKAGLIPEFKKNATQYLRVFMGSFAPSHEDKTAICALLLSELVEL